MYKFKELVDKLNEKAATRVHSLAVTFVDNYKEIFSSDELRVRGLYFDFADYLVEDFRYVSSSKLLILSVSQPKNCVNHLYDIAIMRKYNWL